MKDRYLGVCVCNKLKMWVNSHRRGQERTSSQPVTRGEFTGLWWKLNVEDSVGLITDIRIGWRGLIPGDA